MFSADDLLDILRRRRTLKSIRPEVPGRLPPGWERWLAAMPTQAGAVTGAPPGSFVDAFLQRPLRAPPRPGALLTRWQAFGTLWRQQWHPAEREERGLRVLAMAASLAVHACLAVLLAWMMYLHLLVLLAMPTEAPAVVQVEYIGRGSPDEVSGGALQVREVPREPARPARPAAAAAAQPAPAAPRPATAQPAPAEAVPRQLPVEVTAPVVAATAPPLPQRELPMPALPPTSQPLRVTEVAEPDIDFVLPPTTTQVDPVRQPELAVPTRDVPAPEVVEAMEAELPSRLPTVAVEVPETTRPALEVPRRDIPVPEATEVARLPERPVQAPDVTVQAPSTRIPDIEVATIPTPAGQPVEAPGTEPDAGEAVAVDGASESEADSAADASADAAAGEQVAGETTAPAGAEPGAAEAAAGTPADRTGAGPETAAAPGGWPTPGRGDDWDDASGNRPGANEGGDTGVFDGTGRPRLAGTGDGGPPGGAPPGSEAREAIDLARGGTWLRRPPYDYRPTRFDRFWIPSGTLLEEWVRRGVRQMSIPIPGTSMEIVCVVSILQLGGGCGLTDPDVNDQPSTGRAAPDVPFKPELQDNQDALARPPGG